MRLRSGKIVESILFPSYEPKRCPGSTNLTSDNDLEVQRMSMLAYEPKRCPGSTNLASDALKEFGSQTQSVLFNNAIKNLSNMLHWIFYPILFILSLIRMPFRQKKRQSKNRKPRRSFMTWFVHIFNTFAILLMLYRYLMLENVDEYKELHKHGLDNGKKVTFSTDVYNWYVAPEKLKGLPSHLVLNSDLPIVMYIRDDREADSDTFHRINMLQKLAMNGLNVVAPLTTSDEDLIKVWTRLNMRSEPTKIYLWFDHTSIDRAERLADALSKTVSAPFVAIVESKARYDIPDMEVWSRQITTQKTNEVQNINFLKCPVTSSFPGTANYQEIQTCIGTVNGNIRFHY